MATNGTKKGHGGGLGFSYDLLCLHSYMGWTTPDYTIWHHPPPLLIMVDVDSFHH